jgi:hypothetical protein
MNNDKTVRTLTEWLTDDVAIPSFLPARFLKPESHEGLQQRLEVVDRRMVCLTERGLRPDPNVLEHRTDLLRQIAQFEGGA